MNREVVKSKEYMMKMIVACNRGIERMSDYGVVEEGRRAIDDGRDKEVGY
jgi:hypothetical protein